MNEEELEGHLEELRAKGLNTRGSLRRLLLLRASRNDTAGVLELMKVNCGGIIFVVFSLSSLSVLLLPESVFPRSYDKLRH